MATRLDDKNIQEWCANGMPHLNYEFLKLEAPTVMQNLDQAIESSLLDLIQNGIGKWPEDTEGPATMTFGQFFNGDKNITDEVATAAGAYLTYNVARIFDPPQPNAVSQVEKHAAKLLWRAREGYEYVEYKNNQ